MPGEVKVSFGVSLHSADESERTFARSASSAPLELATGFSGAMLK